MRNKTKKLIALLSVCCMATAVAGFATGCNKDKDEATETEKVYQLYVANAEAAGEDVLTYEQWLDSIKGAQGPKGDTGATGKSAYEIWLEQEGNAGKTVEEFLASLKGEQGEEGKKGDDGAPAHEHTYDEDALPAVLIDTTLKKDGLGYKVCDDEDCDHIEMVVLGKQELTEGANTVKVLGDVQWVKMTFEEGSYQRVALDVKTATGYDLHKNFYDGITYYREGWNGEIVEVDGADRRYSGDDTLYAAIKVDSAIVEEMDVASYVVTPKFTNPEETVKYEFTVGKAGDDTFGGATKVQAWKKPEAPAQEEGEGEGAGAGGRAAVDYTELFANTPYEEAEIDPETGKASFDLYAGEYVFKLDTLGEDYVLYQEGKWSTDKVDYVVAELPWDGSQDNGYNGEDAFKLDVSKIYNFTFQAAAGTKINVYPVYSIWAIEDSTDVIVTWEKTDPAKQVTIGDEGTATCELEDLVDIYGDVTKKGFYYRAVVVDEPTFGKVANAVELSADTTTVDFTATVVDKAATALTIDAEEATNIENDFSEFVCGTNGSYMYVTTTVATSGKYDLVLGNVNNGEYTAYVDSFTATGVEGKYKGTVTFTLELTAGEHTIAIKTNAVQNMVDKTATPPVYVTAKIATWTQPVATPVSTGYNFNLSTGVEYVFTATEACTVTFLVECSLEDWGVVYKSLADAELGMNSPITPWKELTGFATEFSVTATEGQKIVFCISHYFGSSSLLEPVDDIFVEITVA